MLLAEFTDEQLYSALLLRVIMWQKAHGITHHAHPSDCLIVLLYDLMAGTFNCEYFKGRKE